MRNRTSSFNLKCVHPETVEQILSSLKNSKSCGLDSIDTFSLKLAGQRIIPALTHIINLSILTQQFPTSWKTAKIIPLYKKDDPLSPKNYRPVAILPILSKVLEKAVFLQIVDYMDSNHLIHPNHHGFRAGHSTTTGLIQMYDAWVEALDCDKYTGACFLDLSEAFDIVDHPLLMEKLKLYGFSENSLSWVGSYLTGRSQTVYIESFLSKVLLVPTSVPQGSILGPLLYIIFTNELPELVHDHEAQGTKPYNMKCTPCGNLCCYADDSTFSYSSSSIQEISDKISENYTGIAQFMSNNKLKLNGDKTHLMLLATDHAWRHKLDENSLSLNTGNEIISTSKSEKLLGGLINQNLKWTDHILLNEESLLKKLGTRLNALKQMGKVADFKTRKMLANGLFMSKLVYLMPLWGGCDKFLIKALQIVQNKAARSVTKLGIFTPVRTLLKQCGWLSVNQLVFFHTVVLLYKTLQNQSPEYLLSMAGTEYNYKSRAKDEGKLRVVPGYKIESDLNIKSYRWRSIKCWNQLPQDITSTINLYKFKVKLKAWVLKNVDLNP